MKFIFQFTENHIFKTKNQRFFRLGDDLKNFSSSKFLHKE